MHTMTTHSPTKIMLFRFILPFQELMISVSGAFFIVFRFIVPKFSMK